MNDLIGGHVDYLCEQVVRHGRSEGTAKESRGMSCRRTNARQHFRTFLAPRKPARTDYQLNVWSAVYAPRGTTEEIVAKLATHSTRHWTSRRTAEKLANLGGTVPPKSERGPEYPPQNSCVGHSALGANSEGSGGNHQGELMLTQRSPILWGTPDSARRHRQSRRR